MMKKRQFLIFAGTSEGRELAEFLNANEIPATVCVATEYGEELMEHMPWIQVQMGRMDQEQMEAYMRQMEPIMVIDATHPYADMVTKNIVAACQNTGIPYERLLRSETKLDDMEGLQTFGDCQEAAQWLNQQQGNVLLTTGIKELPVFAECMEDKERLYARVLLQEAVFEEMERYGLSRKQIICMQGPFSKNMNVATLHMVDARYMVTKESGTVGGFQEKVEAAKEAGVTCVVIRRPVSENGNSVQEIQKVILKQWAEYEKENCKKYRLVQQKMNHKRTITLLGIGMGAGENMTIEGSRACEEADCIIGAKRMLETLKVYGKPMADLYLSDDIAAFVEQHEEYQNILVGLSGDVGFYSGAKKLIEKLQAKQLELNVQLLCGISSVVYFASKMQIAWEDMTLVSTHGREQNLISAVKKNPKVFALASNAASICEMAEKLCRYGLEKVEMYVGTSLSYPEERIYSGVAEDFVAFDEPGICAVVLMNEAAKSVVVTHGIPDEAFLRGKVPMTKEEVRSISISKLQLCRDSVVYDVGAGTGSVSIECARIVDRGKVYAIEWKEDAWKLIAENRSRFGVANLEIVPGRAPEAMMDLPVPTHAFIGGSGGNLKIILRELLKKNPQIRIVVNCITLETVNETMDAAKDLGLELTDIASVNISKSRSVGGYHLMMGQNPVYVMVLTNV